MAHANLRAVCCRRSLQWPLCARVDRARSGGCVNVRARTHRAVPSSAPPPPSPPCSAQEIENYVHRIGRTGRCGKTGVATTFINRNDAEEILLDLKYLLIESKQRLPLVLKSISGANDRFLNAGGTKGCAYCSGLGHRVTECPKLQKEARAKAGAGGGGGGGGGGMNARD